MDQETKVVVSKMQQALWHLMKAQQLLVDVDCNDDLVEEAIDQVGAEMDELCSLEKFDK